MAKGRWSESNKPDIPGFYNRFKTAAEEVLRNGTTGVLALTVKSNWGPVKEPTSIIGKTELKQLFGSDINYTSYKLGLLALLGKPKEVLIYRLADEDAKCSSVKLQSNDDIPVDVIELTSKYPTTRQFNITIKSNITDENKRNIILCEGSKQLFNITVKGTFKEIAEQINKAVANEYVDAKALTTSSTTELLNTVSNVALTGGNNGCDKITNSDYIEAMEVFEGYDIDAFVIDTFADSALQTSIQTWVNKCKEDGSDFLTFTCVEEGATLDDANQRSQEYNDYLVNNVYVESADYDGVTYNNAEVTVYIAALAIGKGLKESICNEKTIFTNIKPKLTKPQISAAIKAGTIVLYKDGDDIVVADDVNTYKTYTSDEGKALGTIQTVVFTKTVNHDTALYRKDFIGKVSGNSTGRTIVLSALSGYFETLNNSGVIADDFSVEIDEELQAKAEEDEMFWKWTAQHYKNLKRIYGTGTIRE